MSEYEETLKMFWYWWNRMVAQSYIEVHPGQDDLGMTYYDIEYRCEECGRDLELHLEGDQFQTEDDVVIVHEISRAMRGKFKCVDCKED